MNKEYTFFWRNKSPFSNWFKSDFIHQNVQFNCAEQAMMHHKALLFNDTYIATKILLVKNPSEHKALGRQVKNYSEDVWVENRERIVKDILRSKFSSSTFLANYLLEHRGTTIVEASPYDRIWGIGYEEHNALENIDNWGLNLLGKLLTELAHEDS